MATWKRVLERLKNGSIDITYDEMQSLLVHLGYSIDTMGKTSGSRTRFICEGREDILLHRPHPQKELNEFCIKRIYETLKGEQII